MNRIITLSLLAAATLASGCAREAGYEPVLEVYGNATQANFVAQDAYGRSDERLRSLNESFRQNATDTVTFAFDSARLDSTARSALDSQVRWLKANEAVRMTIVGHADRVGTERYNDRIGLRRARTVLAYLSRNGISKKRLEAISTRGEREPVVQTEERERRNRRAQTFVSGFARNFVGTGMDGEVAARLYDTYQSGNYAVTEAAADIN